MPCPSCHELRANPKWCLDQYHQDGTKDNPVLDKLLELHQRLGFGV